MLTVNVERRDEAVVLRCAGRLVSGEETALLCAAGALAGRAVILDLENVEAIDAAGIGLLVSLQAAGIYLTLVNPQASVRQALRVTHVDSIFEIAEREIFEEKIVEKASAPEKFAPARDEVGRLIAAV